MGYYILLFQILPIILLFIKNYDNDIENNDQYKYPSLKCTDKYKEVQNKIQFFIKQKDDDNSDFDGNNYMKIKINSNDYLSLNRLLFLFDVVTLIRSVFEDDSTYYSQLFLKKIFYDEEKKIYSKLQSKNLQIF